MGIKSTQIAITRQIVPACLVACLAALTACGGNVGVVRDAGETLSGTAPGSTSGATPVGVATGASVGTPTQSSVSAVTPPVCGATLRCAP